MPNMGGNLAGFKEIKKRVRLQKSSQASAFSEGRRKKALGRVLKKNKLLLRFKRRLAISGSEIEKVLAVLDPYRFSKGGVSIDEIKQAVTKQIEVLSQRDFRIGFGRAPDFPRLFVRRKKIHAMQELSKFGVWRAIPLLQSYLKHPDPKLRIAAIRSLVTFNFIAQDHKFETEKKLEILKSLRLREKDKDKKVRATAKSCITALELQLNPRHFEI